MSELKQKQKFENNWKQFQALTGTVDPAQKVKIASSDVPSHFQTVVLERNQKAEKDFQIKLLGIIEAKIALDNDIRRGRDELAKREEQEYEKLNKAFNDAFSMVKMAQKQGQQLLNQVTGNFTSSEEETSTSTGEGEDKA